MKLIYGLGLTPVHFFSHGSTRMVEEDTEAARYWKKCGDEALANGVKGIVMMVCVFVLATTSFAICLETTDNKARVLIGAVWETRLKWPPTLTRERLHVPG